MFEIEIKARIDKVLVNAIREKINLLNPSRCERVVYHDAYYDNKHHDYYKSEKELRIRKIISSNKTITNLLTFKDAPIDDATKSKKEHEVSFSDYNTMSDILLSMGFEKDIEFIKECENFHIYCKGKDIAITIAFLPELKEYYIELEILSEYMDKDIKELKLILLELLSDLTISESSVTASYYTDMVREKRVIGTII